MRDAMMHGDTVRGRLISRFESRPSHWAVLGGVRIRTEIGGLWDYGKSPMHSWSLQESFRAVNG